MDCYPPMFPLDQMDEFLDQHTPLPSFGDEQPTTLLEDTLQLQSAPSMLNSDFSIKEDSGKGTINPLAPLRDTDNKNKAPHREVEKLRRQKMSYLHKSLKSLLPNQNVKGRRKSMSDHMDEATNYIKHLENRIAGMREKREELKRLVDPGPGNERGEASSRKVSVTIEISRTGVHVLLGMASDGSVPLSRVLEVLHEGGLDVVNCISANRNGSLNYSIRCEVSEGRSIDTSELQKKLASIAV